MRVSLLAASLLAGLAVGCTAERAASPTTKIGQAGTASPHARVASAIGGHSSVATYPDRGTLFGYDASRPAIHKATGTWYPVQVSEAHALQAIVDGGMTIQGPNGAPIRLAYQRHVEHADGNWTFIGRPEGAAPATMR